MNHPVQEKEHRSFPNLKAAYMNEDFKNEFQLVLSGLQRLDSKIDSLQSSTKDDLKQLDSKIDVLQSSTKTDLKQLIQKLMHYSQQQRSI